MDATILIVENDKILGPELKSLLEFEGLKPILCKDYGSAYNELLSLDPPPLLAIVDLKLTNSLLENNRDGVDLLQPLQDKEVFAIVLSVFTNEKPTAHRIGDFRHVVLKTIDKQIFIDEGTTAFLKEVHNALAIARAAREAEGFLPVQQSRLSTLLP